MRKLKPLVWLGVIVLVVSMFAIVACTAPTPANNGGTTTATKEAKDYTPTSIPTPDEFGVVLADQWKDQYPDQYNSYQKNLSNSEKPSYLLEYPFLTTLYNGTGFGKDYNEARGHLYTLTDVNATQRPHATANCLTCKTPQLTTMVNTEGPTVYAKTFDEVYAQVNEPISCYNCHENTGNTLVVSAGFLNDALGADKSQVKDGFLVCGQCHNEYYFDATTKATTLPWKGLSNMNPDAMLKYYNDLGFSDFTNGVSGASMIKVQHPEFETILGEGGLIPTMSDGSFTCETCHMGTATNSDGDEYTSHFWQSPMDNQDLIDNTCNPCHGDIQSKVADIQKDTRDRLNTIGGKLADLHTKIGDAAANGTKSADEIAQLRSTIRDAQFYYDFCFVENSDGAHNTALTKYVLDKSESLTDQALATF